MTSALGVRPDHFRFRVDAEPETDPSRRSWRATYSHSDGWSTFQIELDLASNRCTFVRWGDGDYSPLLKDLARALTGVPSPVPDVSQRVAKLSLDMELLGLKLSRVAGRQMSPGAAGPFRVNPQGDWLVVQVFMPGSRESFYLGLNNRMGCGEIAPSDDGQALDIIKTLAQIFS